MKRVMLWVGVLVLLGVGVLQFIPAPPVLVPAAVPQSEREAHRLLDFAGIANFRDLGGYAAADGRRVKWGVLYRTGTLAHASGADLEVLNQLNLVTLIDFRSALEKAEEPNRLPESPTFKVVEIPTLDKGNETLINDIFERVESGNFDGFDPHATMIEGNRQFATEFTPQYRQFVHEVLKADGAPVVWHCSAGKDRAGFAAAILLRLLGVDQASVMRDYMASKEPSLASRKNTLRMLRLFRGDEAADKLAVLMGVDEAWLAAAFDEIDKTWGGFDRYVENGLQLDAAQIAQLRNNLLVSASDSP